MAPVPVHTGSSLLGRGNKMLTPSDVHPDATSSWQGSVDVTALSGGSSPLPLNTLMSFSLCCLWGISMVMVAGEPLCAPWP